MFLAPSTSTSLQTTLAAAAHPAEGQFVHEEQTLSNAKSLIYRVGARRQQFPEQKDRISHNVNLSKKDNIEAMPPNM
jgi:hypothetical protein